MMECKICGADMEGMDGRSWRTHWDGDLRNELESTGAVTVFAEVSREVTDQIEDIHALVEAIGGQIAIASEMLIRVGCKQLRLLTAGPLPDGGGLHVEIEGRP